MNNDTIDHLVTGGIAVLAIIGAIIVQLHSGQVPDWLTVIAGAASGFYFRGRVNGQYNQSTMTKVQKFATEVKQAATEVKEAVSKEAEAP